MNRAPQPSRSFASSEDAADAFDAVKPKLGIISHDHHERAQLEAIRRKSDGRCIVAKDLTVINIA
jgi:hypothetical protein